MLLLEPRKNKPREMQDRSHCWKNPILELVRQVLVLGFIMTIHLHCQLTQKELPIPKPENTEITDFITPDLPSTPYADSKFLIWDKNNFLHFREYSLTPKPVGQVLLIHGFAASTYSFRHTISVFLEHSYRVVLVDLPGFGYSMRRQGLDTSAQGRAKLLWSFLDSISEKNEKLRWTILGHSMGGGIASYMAQERPSEVARLFLVAPSFREPGVLQKGLTYLPFFETILHYQLDKTIQNKEAFGEILNSAYQNGVFFPLEEEILGYQRPLYIFGTIEYSIDLIRNSKNLEKLQYEKLGIPIYIFQGGEDTWVPESLVLESAKKFPNAKVLYYPKLGHCPMETSPRQINHDLSLILKGYW
jgi:pimeloyl-ACP methyl ester carboxylesterase